MKNNKCVFCSIVKGIDKDNILTKQSDIIFKNRTLTAFISAESWTNNKGHLILIPNKHINNIYQITDDLLIKLFRKTKELSIIIKKAYKCDGVTIKQHNEPAGGQTIPHFHVHIIPRYFNDNMNKTKYELVRQNEREKYAKRLRRYLNKN